jgi:predicted nucleic acid-binding protein
MTRIFLDANVLFSASWREKNGLLRLWLQTDFRLVTSSYAVVEVERNLEIKRPDALLRFHSLMQHVEICGMVKPLSDSYGLPAKDVPILTSAIGSACSILLTGDVADFGHLIGKKIESVEVMTPSQFFQSIT